MSWYCYVCKRKLRWYQRAGSLGRVIHATCTHRSYEDLEPSELLALPSGLFRGQWRRKMYHAAEAEDGQQHHEEIDSILKVTQKGELAELLASPNSVIQTTALFRMQELNAYQKCRKKKERRMRNCICL